MEKVIEFFFGNIFIVSRCNNASLNIFYVKNYEKFAKENNEFFI